MLDRLDVFLPAPIVVSLINPSASISFYSDQNVPITTASATPGTHTGVKNTVRWTCVVLGSPLCHLLATIPSTGLLQSHQQTGPNQSNVPQ